MSKITFRADDDLVAQLDAFDASKSEVMREALRTYLETDGEPADSAPDAEPTSAEESLDDLIAERVDAVLADRLGERRRPQPQDVNVNISLEDAVATTSTPAKTASDDAESTEAVADRTTERTCSQCGETVSDDHVYCPNCGEKTARRVFCECGDELRSDWSFCPSCGRRTAAADVLDQ